MRYCFDLIPQATLNNNLTNLGYSKITSPVDGTVISRAVDVGQTVAASFNTPTLFEVAKYWKLPKSLSIRNANLKTGTSIPCMEYDAAEIK